MALHYAPYPVHLSVALSSLTDRKPVRARIR
jgi:hypothetical protein